MNNGTINNPSSCGNNGNIDKQNNVADELKFNFNKDDNKQKFRDNFSKLKIEQQKGIKEELNLFLESVNEFKVFLNNICVILANNNGAFSHDSLDMINFLKYLAENNISELKEIYEILI